ncbi:flagellar hook basal-body protein [Soehngenia longivitae]|uniref:Flagellar hook basal-body protein n=1 Tax=Soehngenia longivitae TaxID=2562294 RepID=A0A4Z0D5I1_9FIRM|nr:flagellar hook basal-body protein [Soehngenia longivitae]TFZ39942.1 flagellar hook basal-body protein [Soehngenia longivitae]
MNISLHVGRSGLNANQRKMDSVSDDIANVNTVGYKSKQISFRELLNTENVSAGTSSLVSKLSYNQGALIESQSPYNLAIEGDGFFGISKNGQIMLTRSGGFILDANNTIVDSEGNNLIIDYTIQPNEWGNETITIDEEGYLYQNIDGENTSLGRVVLFYPDNLDALIPMDGGKFISNGEIFSSIDSDFNFGNIKQYFLEQSNVDLIKSLTDMIITQRAYSMSSKVVETADEIYNMSNNLKR